MATFEIPARQGIKIEVEEAGKWVVLDQDGEKVAIYIKDLPEVIECLCDIAGIGMSRPNS